jgi:transcriptional regulator with XRE-family HTH domain
MLVEDYVDMQAMGERVLLLRRRANLSQHDLAQKAGVDAMTISRLERGTKKRLEVEPLARLSRALGVTTDDLLGVHASGNETAAALPPQPKRQRARKAATVV